MKRLVLICVVAGCLALPSGAGAATWPATNPPLYQRYLKAAERYWHLPTPPGTRVVMGKLSNPEDIAAFAHTDADNLIVLDPLWWGIKLWDGWQACAVIVHEVGHLHGFDHTNNPRDVMNWMMTDSIVVPACDPWTFTRRHALWHKLHPGPKTRGWKRAHRRWLAAN